MNILIDGQTLETEEINRGIGIYFKNVLNNMMKLSYEHDWYITLSDFSALNSLDSWVRKRIHPICFPEFKPSSDFDKNDAYTDRILEIVKQYKIERMWMPNAMMVNVLFLKKMPLCSAFVTMYDLIPKVMPIQSWPKEILAEYNRRLEFIKENDVGLFCISDATKKDFVEYVGEVSCLKTTFLAADSKLFFKLRETGGLSLNPNIVFTGGFDYRKNIDGAIEIFKRAREKYQKTNFVNVKFYIICKCDENTKTEFVQKMEKLNIADSVILTGYVPDETLAEYYYNADVFFFPSLYEGFGLPILEAMLSGAYVLSADNSSLPEVCQDKAILGDVNDIDEMVDKLYLAFKSAEQEDVEAKRNRQLYAYQFSWEKTAQKTLEALCGVPENEKYRRYKVALVTPWPQMRTGIATFEYKLVPYLKKYCDVDVFVDADSDTELVNYDHGNLYPLQKLNELNKDYDHILYQIGNNGIFHKNIYEYLEKYPGIAEIHDYVLQPFFYFTYMAGENRLKTQDKFEQILNSGYGHEGVAYFKKIQIKNIARDFDLDLKNFPMCHSVINIAKATIFHNHWSKEQISDENNVFVIPLPAFAGEHITNQEEADERQRFQKQFMLKTEILVGCFGYVNANKRPEIVLEAVRDLLEAGEKIKLIYFGECDLPELRQLIIKNSLEHDIFITGYLNRKEYETALRMVDIVVNLRYPSMGEASGTLCEAFQYGKPVLVTDINQYTEYPDEVCWKIPIGRYEIPMLKAMIKELVSNVALRKAMGDNARNYAEVVLNPERIGELYTQMFRRMEEIQ